MMPFKNPLGMIHAMHEVPFFFLAFALAGESCIDDGWIVRYKLVGYGTGVYAGKLVVVVKPKDVCEETIVGRCIFGPSVGDVLDLAC